ILWLLVPGWWKLAAAACLAVLALVTIGKSVPQAETWTSWSTPLSGKVIVVDPGHGGIDGGAVSRNGEVVEKHINLSIALYLRDYLQQAGALVIMTRETDRDLADIRRGGRQRQDLLRRVMLVDESNADMLVSIHMNSVASSKWSGAQTFYHPGKNSENKRLAALIQEELRSGLVNTQRSIVPLDHLFILKSV